MSLFRERRSSPAGAAIAGVAGRRVVELLVERHYPDQAVQGRRLVEGVDGGVGTVVVDEDNFFVGIGGLLDQSFHALLDQSRVVAGGDDNADQGPAGHGPGQPLGPVGHGFHLGVEASAGQAKLGPPAGTGVPWPPAPRPAAAPTSVRR